jgi:long-chain acyl-CoA synthetase
MHPPMRVLKPILHNAIFSPLRTAIVDDQRSWKAITLYIAALHLARRIRRTTDRPHVGFMLPTSGLAPLAIMATWLLGKTTVPLNYLLRGEDLAYVIDDAELDAVITVKPMIDHFGDLPGHVKQIRLDEMSFRGLPPLRRAARRADDHLAALVYTSGTSGRPKGVMLTSGNLAANVRQCVRWAGFTREDVMLGVLPQFHSFGLTVLTLVPLSVGCEVIYTARFMPKKILELLKEHRPTAFIGIPSMFNALLSAKSATPEHFSSLKWIVSGSEPLPKAVFRGFKERFGVNINEGYGLTETSPVTNWCQPQNHREHSVGKALPEVQMKIVSPTGQRLGPGEEGEICFKGPNVMPGYHKMPKETAEVFDEEGYFRTGDMGKVDEDGHLYITGRIKEMLIIGGENVFPREIEEVLNAHPAVDASVVIGMQDESRGEVALAFVELKEGAEFDETELRSFCRQRLAQFKVPREIRALERLPRNPTGKLMRRELTAHTKGRE